MHMLKLAAVAIALIVSPALLAQTYIVRDGDCGAVTLHVTRGNDFPNLGETIAADRVNGAHVFAKPKQRFEAEVAAGPRSLTFNADIPAEGVVVAAVGLKPE